jgi:hypothetical protein
MGATSDPAGTVPATSDEQQPQPHFLEFDELYHWVVRGRIETTK